MQRWRLYKIASEYKGYPRAGKTVKNGSSAFYRNMQLIAHYHGRSC